VKIGFSDVWQKFKEGSNIFLSTILVTIFVSFAFILLKKTGSDLEVGAYSTAMKLASIIQVMILVPFGQAFFPHITKAASEDLFIFENKMTRAFYYLLVQLSGFA
jgi:O-antigen/teichoic acid export membrane protein